MVLIGVVHCMIASARVKTTYKKYEKVGSRSGYTADQVAYMILRNAGDNGCVNTSHLRRSD